MPPKPLLVLGCISGSLCSIIVPLSITSGSGSASIPDRTQNNRLPSNEHLHPSMGDLPEEIPLKFDGFWSAIENDYKASQKNKNLNENQLPWRSELRGLIDPFSVPNSWWIIEEKIWRDCEVKNPETKIYCGYLKFKDNEDVEYKLKVSRYNLNESRWDLVLVKKNKENTLFFNHGDNNWIESQVNFDKLTTFSNKFEHEWEKIKENSISKK